MKYFIIISFIFSINILTAQDNIEHLRAKGYEAKEAGDYSTAIKRYGKILKLNPEDYDAQLALTRLYFKTEKHDKSIAIYNKMLANDPSDVEVLKGLGICFLYTDRLDKAESYYKKAINLLPDHIPLYLDLAKTYSWDDRLEDAIAIYQNILKIDNTYSGAYQGIGKMYYWMEKPYAALTYYKKAVELDPQKESIKKEYEDVKNQTLFHASYTPKYVNEIEESYEINAFIQQVGFKKRINDYFDLSANFLFDYSNRDYTNTDDGDTIRWYNTAWLKAGFIKQNHKGYIYGGYSQSDSKFSSYGLNWKWNFDFKSVKFSNNLTAGYDYFYYWNNVGQKALADNLKLTYNKFVFNLGYNYGIVDKAFILDIPNDRYEEDYNPFIGYRASLGYRFLSKPKMTISANYSYLNYTYKSNRYYSPMGRKLYGGDVIIYYPIGNFYVYSNFAYNIGSEYYYENINSSIEKYYINANNWSASCEAGYNYKSFSASLSSGRFYNDYYQNFLIALNFKYGF